jgi:predicted DNA-binding protein YlxM (UPF0122 family)
MDNARARQVIIYLIRERLNKSYPFIGKKLGGRDHTTILYSYNKIKKRIKKDKKLRNDIQKIMPSVISEIDKKNQSIIIKSIKDLPESKLKPKLFIRQNDILRRYREGWTLEEIATKYKITRQRVQQIVQKGLIYSSRELLIQGIELDLNEYLREEKRKHVLSVKKKQGIFKKKIPKTEKRWSRHYDSCRKCGTTVIKHHSHGYCRRCYPKTQIFKELQESSRLRHIEERKKHVSEYSKKYLKRPEVIKKIKEKENLKHFGGNREKAISRDGEKCKKCGLSREESYKRYKKDLFVLHIENKNDNRLDNLVTLCLKCFSKRLRRRKK